MNKKISTQMIATMGLLIALVVVLSNILSIETQFLKVTFEFIPKMIMGLLFGPFWTGIGSVVADVIGNTMFARAPFFIGFTFNKMLEGLIYGYFFYHKKITLRNSFISTLLIVLVINLFLTPIWLSIMYSVPLNSLVIWLPRLIKAIFTIPLQTFTLYMFGNKISLKAIRDNIKV